MSASASPAEDHLLALAARLHAADAAVAEALDPRPASRLGRLRWRFRRQTTARIAAQIRPDVAELAAAAWAVYAELGEAERGYCAASAAARRISAPARPRRTAAARDRRRAAAKAREGATA